MSTNPSYFLGSQVENLPTPAVIIDLDQLDRNLNDMQGFANMHGKNLRPHAKAHKCPDIARMQLERGATGLTFAKASEADYVTRSIRADMNLDVFVANEVVQPTALATLASLKRRVTRLSVAVDNAQGVDILGASFDDSRNPLDVVVEIDSGLRRAGVQPGRAAVELAEQIARHSGLHIKGVFTHAGHAYRAKSPDELQRIASDEANAVLESAEALRQAGFDCEVVSVGSTPTIKHSLPYDGTTEGRPGAYFAYDRTQSALGACQPNDIAMHVLTRVSTKHSNGDGSRVLVDAGSKMFSSDIGAHGVATVSGYGSVLSTGDTITRLSEEHGILDGVDVSRYNVGETLTVIPNHVCTVMNLADIAFGVRNGIIERIFRIVGRGQVT